MTKTSTQLSTIISGCIEGERQSQAALYQLLSPEMFSLCLKYCKNNGDAEYVLEQGFIKLFLNISSYKGKGSFKDWCKFVFIDTAFAYYRNKNSYSVKSMKKEILYFWRLNQLRFKMSVGSYLSY